jgi:hypothetical protein
VLALCSLVVAREEAVYTIVTSQTVVDVIAALFCFKVNNQNKIKN